jgi:hypothetical protein
LLSPIYILEGFPHHAFASWSNIHHRPYFLEN